VSTGAPGAPAPLREALRIRNLSVMLRKMDLEEVQQCRASPLRGRRVPRRCGSSSLSSPTQILDAEIALAKSRGERMSVKIFGLWNDDYRHFRYEAEAHKVYRAGASSGVAERRS